MTPSPTGEARRSVTAQDVKIQARRLGFEACGISKAEELAEEAGFLETWLQQGYHGSMSWMERNFDKRIDPRKLVPGARSVISVMDVYYQGIDQPESQEIGRVSRYAWGQDYHVVVKDRLHLLFDWIRRETGDVQGRVFVDSAPVMDKAWAARSGLGWIGKHTNLLHSRLGSWFFLGEIICDLALEPDGPIPDHCGTCTRCIDACPTDAIVEPYVVDANRCISYLTIEHRKDDIGPELAGEMDNWVFGCDVCQDVCPWNKFSPTTTEPAYLPSSNIEATALNDWGKLSASAFDERFGGSAVKRTRHEGLMRNVRIASRNLDARPGEDDA
ncbi:MAG: tRNA epoxyqueuosine(34) reductase QueG [Rhodothermales bacterium]|jgi:epoxyqueuosine reductase